MFKRFNAGVRVILLASVAWTLALVWTVAAFTPPAGPSPVGPTFRSGTQPIPNEAKAASAGCITCHTKTDEASMHPSGPVTLGCATCHGRDPKVSVAASLAAGRAEYKARQR